MRILRASLGLVVAFGAAATMFVACGLSENGTETDGSVDASDELGLDVILKDVVPQDTFVAPTCQTIDASCLGIEVPTGWVLMDISDAGSACPGNIEDWETHPYVTNPVATSNACSCGTCATDGGYTCNGKVQIGGGVGACNDQDATIAGGTATCVPIQEFAGVPCLNSNAWIAASNPALSGTPGCNAPFTGTQLASATPMLGCKPQQCTTDYCGLRAQGFETCILHNNDPSGTCPAGFHNAFGTSALASVPGNYQVACQACGCSVNSPSSGCTSSLRLFAGINAAAQSCDGDGSTQGVEYVETVDAGACATTGLCGYSSVYYVPNAPPTPSCNTTNPTGSGVASLTNPVTICCAP